MPTATHDPPPAPESSPAPPQSAIADDSSQTTRAEPWGWTRRQRIGLATLLSLLLVILVVQFVRRPFRFDDSAVIVSGNRVTLPQRIDPNTASLEQLARIPHLGDTLAARIIQWRDARKPLTPDGFVFRQPADLDAVPGIGKKLIEQLQPFLQFPDEAAPQPTTAP